MTHQTRRQLLLVSSCIALVAYYFRFSLHPGGGTELYPQAAECMVNGLPMNTCKPDFTYPPVFAFMVIPLIYLPMWARHLTWYLTLIGLTYASFRLAESLVLEAFQYQLTGRQLVLFRVVSVALSLNFILAGFEHQAYDVIVLFCLLVGLTGLAKNRPLWVTLGMGMAAAIKATPLLFLPYLFLKRGWKPFALCLGVYVGLSILPDVFLSIDGGQGTYYGNWVRQVALQPFIGETAAGMPMQRPLHDKFWAGDNPSNFSLRQLVLHLSLQFGIPEYFSQLLYGLYGLCSLFGLLVFRWTSQLKIAPVLDGSLLLIGMLLLSPMSSRTHFVTLLLPFAAISAYMFMEPAHRPFLTIASGLSCLLNNLTSRDLVGRQLAKLAEPWGPVVFGTIILGLAIGYIAHAESKRELPSPGLGRDKMTPAHSQ